MWRGVVLCLLYGCGRIDFDPLAQPADAGGSALAWLGSFTATPVTASATATFTAAAHAAGNAVVFHVECDQVASPASVTVTAPGWAPVALAAINGTTPKWGTVFGAIAPDALATTFTVTWDVTCSDLDVLADEFAGTDPTGGTTTFEVVQVTAGPLQCVDTVTTVSAGDAIWAGCSSAGTLDGVTAPAIRASDDGHDDWSAYLVPAAAAGTPETIGIHTATGGTYVMTTVAIKPR